MDGKNWQVFMANSLYGARPGKLNMPRIREVYMALANSATAVAEFKKGAFDVLLPNVVRSLPGGVDALRKEGINVVGPLPSRRIYFLAINLRKPVFESRDVRLAMAHAIQRGDILKNAFGGVDGDKPLRGPYPTGSWACDPKDTKELDNAVLAKQIIAQGDAKKKLKDAGPLNLVYPQGDKAVEEAMKAIAEQLTTLGAQIQLQPADAHDLRDKVEGKSGYDLAYYYYDFPSEAYWLWPLFHPDGWIFGSGKTNDEMLESRCRFAMGRRDPVELQKLTYDIHNQLKKEMWIIPLWQLGSYVALKEDIQTPPLDPLRVLADVGNWRRAPKR
jgi:ABC-type transport system substrate-binding protein